eukprot:scaffold8015_cov165-Ochromonas_danica.AAC.23
MDSIVWSWLQLQLHALFATSCCSLVLEEEEAKGRELPAGRHNRTLPLVDLPPGQLEKMGDFYPTNPGYDKVDEVVLGKKPPMRYFIAYSLALVGSVFILLATILRLRQDFSLESLLRLLGHSLCLLFFLHGFWETFPRKKPRLVLEWGVQHKPSPNHIAIWNLRPHHPTYQNPTSLVNLKACVQWFNAGMESIIIPWNISSIAGFDDDFIPQRRE